MKLKDFIKTFCLRFKNDILKKISTILIIIFIQSLVIFLFTYGINIKKNFSISYRNHLCSDEITFTNIEGFDNQTFNNIQGISNSYNYNKNIYFIDDNYLVCDFTNYYNYNSTFLKDNAKTNSIILSNKYSDSYKLSDCFKVDGKEYKIIKFDNIEYDYIIDINDYSKDHDIYSLNITYSYNKNDDLMDVYDEFYSLKVTLNQTYKEYLNLTSFAGINIYGDVHNIANYSFIVIVIICLILTVCTVGTINNSFYISMYKNSEIYGLYLSLGMKKNSIKKYIYFDFFTTMLISTAISTLLVICLYNGLKNITAQTIYLINAMFIDESDISEFTHFFDFPIYIPFVIYLGVSLISFILERMTTKKYLSYETKNILNFEVFYED